MEVSLSREIAHFDGTDEFEIWLGFTLDMLSTCPGDLETWFYTAS